MMTVKRVVRDHYDCWIWNFSKKIGSCPILEAKLWGAYAGFLITWEKNVRKIMLEMGCKEEIDILEGGEKESLPISTRIQRFISRSWLILINHMPQELNKMVNGLARWTLCSTTHDSEFKFVLPTPPLSLHLPQSYMLLLLLEIKERYEIS